MEAKDQKIKTGHFPGLDDYFHGFLDCLCSDHYHRVFGQPQLCTTPETITNTRPLLLAVQSFPDPLQGLFPV